MSRSDFGDGTRHVIAARAGFRCSYPGCGKLTIGPAKSPGDFEDTGIACHIYAAAKNGPRGQGDLTDQALRAASNGIWMCGDHGNMIDKKRGVRFPIQMLLGWKALHEYRISYEHSGDKAPFGFIRSLTLTHSPLFKENTEIDFAKTTFLIGLNATGKTAICEWLTALNTSRNIWRWLKSGFVEYDIMFDAPIEQHLRVEVKNNALALKLDQIAVNRNHARASTVYLPGHGELSISCDLKRVSSLFGIEEISLRSLMPLVSGFFVKGMFFAERLDESEKGFYDLHCVLTNGSVRTYNQLSSGEQGRVLLDIAMAQASQAAQFGATLLIAEIESLGIDWGAVAPYLTYFASVDCKYQTIVTACELYPTIQMLGWQIYTLKKGTAGYIEVKPEIPESLEPAEW